MVTMTSSGVAASKHPENAPVDICCYKIREERGVKGVRAKNHESINTPAHTSTPKCVLGRFGVYEVDGCHCR